MQFAIGLSRFLVTDGKQIPIFGRIQSGGFQRKLVFVAACNSCKQFHARRCNDIIRNVRKHILQRSPLSFLKQFFRLLQLFIDNCRLHIDHFILFVDMNDKLSALLLDLLYKRINVDRFNVAVDFCVHDIEHRGMAIRAVKLRLAIAVRLQRSTAVWTCHSNKCHILSCCTLIFRIETLTPRRAYNR